MRILAVAGARPNFVKVAPLLEAMRRVGASTFLVHTGQHYDRSMSDAFFDDLEIPLPDVNLGIGSGSHVWQISEVMKRLEPEISAAKPDAVVVVGDVNSTVGATIAAVKLGVRVAHVEAGLRSFDRTMPEEINRILTDSISHWLFTSEPSGEINLRSEGIAAERIHFVGNVMIDSLLRHRDQARRRRSFERFGLQERAYAVVTLHRPSNVDSPERLKSIIGAIWAVSQQISILFVIHPRTRARLKEVGVAGAVGGKGLIMADPLGYLDMLSLMDTARLVLTDSGGIQEETTVLGVPCLTIRENTERPVTVELGTNELVGCQTDRIISAADAIIHGESKTANLPGKWDGHASDRIAAILAAELTHMKLSSSLPTSTDAARVPTNAGQIQSGVEGIHCPG